MQEGDRLCCVKSVIGESGKIILIEGEYYNVINPKVSLNYFSILGEDDKWLVVNNDMCTMFSDSKKGNFINHSTTPFLRDIHHIRKKKINRIRTKKPTK